MTAAEFDPAVEAIALVRYALEGDDFGAELVIARAREVDALETLLKHTAITSVEAFKIGFGRLAKPLLTATLDTVAKQAGDHR